MGSPASILGWKNHDEDLNFNEMMEHFSDKGFNSFVRSENPHYKRDEVIDIGEARILYRKLSNIIHGKMATFESVLPDKFQHCKTDWGANLQQVCDVEEILLALWKNRFLCVSEQLLNEFPQLRMGRTSENDPEV
jgi:hypothetical protein